MLHVCLSISILLCEWRDLRSFAKEKRNDMIGAYNYLDNLLNIDTNYFEQMVHRTYPAELQLNKAKSSDTEAACLDVNLPKCNGIVSTTKIYDE